MKDTFWHVFVVVEMALQSNEMTMAALVPSSFEFKTPGFEYSSSLQWEELK